MSNKTLKTVLGGFAVALVFFTSCSSRSTDNNPVDSAQEEEVVVKKDETVKGAKNANVWRPKKEETSELAQLMRDLHANGMERKTSLANGKLHEEHIDNVIDLLTAAPTEAHMKGEGFNPHAQGFIAHYYDITQATSVSEQKEAHNAMVDACVSCHNQFCQGPIRKIEKLYLR